MITQKRLKELVEYIPETGEFYREGKKIGYNNGRGYLKASIDGEEYYLHRMAWLYVYGELPTLLDHIDQDKSNNKLLNLRPASNSLNGHNRGLQNNNKSGWKGVHFVKERNKYVSYIGVQGKRQHIGIFNTLEEAIDSRKKAEEAL